jgi:hypothetical protein
VHRNGRDRHLCHDFFEALAERTEVIIGLLDVERWTEVPPPQEAQSKMYRADTMARIHE